MAKNKKKIISDYEAKIGDFQLLKSNHKKPIKYKNDLGNIKVYFSSFSEACGRIIIMLSQLFFAAGIIYNGFLYSKVIVDLIPNFDQLYISENIMRILFLLLSIFSLLFTLFFILPISICSRARTVQIWCIIFLTFGSCMMMIALGSSIGALYFVNHRNIVGINYIKYFPMIGFIFAWLLLLLGCTISIASISRRIRQAEEAIAQNYYLSRMQIN